MSDPASIGAIKKSAFTLNPGIGFNASGISAQSTPMQNPPASTPAPTFGILGAATSTALPTTTTTAAGLSFPTTIAVTASTANVVSTAPSSTPRTGLTFGTGSTLLSDTNTARSVSFNLTNPAVPTTAPSAPKSILRIGAPVSTASSVPVSSAASTVSGSGDQSINYVQLQELTEKYRNDFKDMQKLLLNQTEETMNRDVVLAAHGDKIDKLVSSMQNLKTEQAVVGQQLDFILSQQKDLEECLVSLEDEVSSYFPELPADDMYKLAENFDSRLKKTLETSKEIITKINDKNRLSENVANPMVAIGRILNHLTNSIQRLENMNADGQIKLNELRKRYQRYTS